MLEFLNSLTLIVNSLKKKKYERIIIINTSLKVIVLLAQKSLFIGYDNSKRTLYMYKIILKMRNIKYRQNYRSKILSYHSDNIQF